MVGKSVLHYEILSEVGRGGMGVVYKAHDTKLERTVALKALPARGAAGQPERIRFLREARAAAALNHPNIATIHSIEEENQELFIVMEFVEGQELGDLIRTASENAPASGGGRQPRCLPVNDAISFALQIAEGLGAAHAAGVIHRDIKPSNILLTPDRRIKIMDFGLAKIEQSSLLTKPGTTLGTVAYMSPEQAQGPDVDRRTDLWSLGIILHEMLAGFRPFRADYEQAIIYCIINQDPEPLPELSDPRAEALQRILRRALEKDPEARYAAAEAFASDLRALRTPSSPGSSQPAPASGHGSGRVETELKSGSTERRQITALYCGIEALSAREAEIDPEDLQRLVERFHQLCTTILGQFGGHVVQASSEGVLAYFGFPQAHEDAPRRAVLSGLELLKNADSLRTAVEHADDIQVDLRAGVHTGLVVAGSATLADPSQVIGKAPAIAMQVEAQTGAGALLVTEPTWQLTRGFFDYAEEGTQRIKGVSRPLPLYRALDLSGARSRLEADLPGNLHDLVGRDKELGILFDAWAGVQEGEGHAVLVNGEPGIGKSRLLLELKRRVLADPDGWVTEGFCSPYHVNTALFPVIDLLERKLLRFEKEDSAADRLGKLEAFLEEFGFPLSQTVPLFANLLALQTDHKYKPLNLNPERRKQKMLAALLNMILTRADQNPLLLLIEDLHWADATTLELLGLIIDQGPTVRVLTVLTHRPDFAPEWKMRSHLSNLTLSRLPQRAISELVRSVTHGRSLPKPLQQHLIEKSDGVPLFVEEMTKMVVETGVVREEDDKYELAGTLSSLQVPSTLRDSLTARLDRLPAAREVAQLGAVLGREFSFDLLEHVSGQDESSLIAALDQLVQAELLYCRGIPPFATYIFKHALIQDAAYESLLKAQRREYHGTVAKSLTSNFGEVAEKSPEIVAHHFTEAGMPAEAIPLWMEAGQRALQRSANLEGVAHLQRALELLQTLPDGPEKIQQELVLQITLGPALMAVKGYAAAEVEAAYARAREICEMVGDTPEIVMVLFGLWAFYVVGASLVTARELGEQILRLVESSDDSGILLEAHVVLGVTLYFQGEFAEAKHHLEEAIRIYVPEEHREHAMMFGQEPGMAARIYLAKTLWIMGEPDRAAELAQEAQAIAKETDHPHTTAFCWTYAAVVAQCCGDAMMTGELGRKTVELSEEQAFPIWHAAATVLSGWSEAQTGDAEAGIAQMAAGTKAWQATGTGLYTAWFLGTQAALRLDRGEIESAEALIQEAVAIEEAGEERLALAEVYRLQAELILAKHSKPTAAQAKRARGWLEKARNTAKEQSAGSWQLRTVCTLARLEQTQENADAAAEALSEAVRAITGGENTQDVQRAKKMLEDLGNSS